MPALAHRTDFLALISVSRANPNGDPLHGGKPRTDRAGCGIISPVCIKRKLRDRLSEMGAEILITPPCVPGDSLAQRAARLKPGSDYVRRACERWYDVRAFGQVFAFPGAHYPGVKGPVTLQEAFSLHPIRLCREGITRCIGYSDDAHGSDIGFRQFVEYGLYALRGSVSAYAAAKTGFSEEDCELLRLALLHMFDNDSSSARPAGSMAVKRLFWWKHSGMLGEYPPDRVFGTVTAELKCSGLPLSFGDYRIIHTPLPGLEPTIYGED